MELLVVIICGEERKITISGEFDDTLFILCAGVEGVDVVLDPRRCGRGHPFDAEGVDGRIGALLAQVDAW